MTEKQTHCSDVKHKKLRCVLNQSVIMLKGKSYSNIQTFAGTTLQAKKETFWSADYHKCSQGLKYLHRKPVLYKVRFEDQFTEGILKLYLCRQGKKKKNQVQDLKAIDCTYSKVAPNNQVVMSIQVMRLDSKLPVKMLHRAGSACQSCLKVPYIQY